MPRNARIYCNTRISRIIFTLFHGYALPPKVTRTRWKECGESVSFYMRIGRARFLNAGSDLGGNDLKV